MLTALPSAGQTILRGQPVFGVNGRPVPLFYGAIPLWRELKTGVDRGPDIKELKENVP
jgi:hypothetical protein